MKQIVIFLSVLLAYTGVIFAAPVAPTTNRSVDSAAVMTLDQLLRWVDESNQTIESGRLQLQAGEFGAAAAGAWADPQLGAELMYIPGVVLSPGPTKRTGRLSKNFRCPPFTTCSARPGRQNKC